MWEPSKKSKAEEKYAAAQKRFKQVAKEKEEARQKDLEHTASLRALRLAKQAADQVAAEAAATQKEAAKPKKPLGLPQAHRRES